jgi:hypothetical protein
MYTFHRGNLKVYMITHFKLQGATPPISVAILTRLGNQYVGTDLLHLLFCRYHNVGAEDNPFT